MLQVDWLALAKGINKSTKPVLSLKRENTTYMEKQIHEDETFDKIDYSEKKLPHQEFSDCVFTNCNFTKSDVSNTDFIDCHFKSCNLSLTVMNSTGIKNITFKDCKLMGIEFNQCSNFLFSASFENCQLDYSSFFKKKMKQTSFTGCALKEVDFREVDLSMAVFKNCDLLNAIFNRTILEKTDFRAAVNYSIDPEINKMKKAKFSYQGIGGLLTKYNIDIE